MIGYAAAPKFSLGLWRDPDMDTRSGGWRGIRALLDRVGKSVAVPARSPDRFVFEALEPRTLLAADPLSSIFAHFDGTTTNSAASMNARADA